MGNQPNNTSFGKDASPNDITPKLVYTYSIMVISSLSHLRNAYAYFTIVNKTHFAKVSESNPLPVPNNTLATESLRCDSFSFYSVSL